MRVNCINKERNEKGVITYYTLMSELGSEFNATGSELKDAIRKGIYDVINLQIDKLGRLVDKSVKIEASSIEQLLDTKLTKKEIKEINNYIKELQHIHNEKELAYICTTPTTRQFIDKIVSKIKDVAMKDKVTAWRFSYRNEITGRYSSNYSAVEIKEIVESCGLSYCATSLLFYLASKNDEIALIKFGIEGVDGLFGEMILTANYDKAKEFILDITKKASEKLRVSQEKMIKSHYLDADNMLGREFIYKLMAELDI